MSGQQAPAPAGYRWNAQGVLQKKSSHARLLLAVIIVVIIVLIIFFAVWFLFKTVKLSVATPSAYGIITQDIADYPNEVMIVVPVTAPTSAPNLSKAYMKKAWLKTSAFGGSSVTGTVVSMGQSTTGPWTITLAVKSLTSPIAGATAAGSGMWTIPTGASDTLRVDII